MFVAKKTRRIFGSIKWCIVCAPKPDLTKWCIKKWIGQVRCENKTQLRKHKVLHFMHPKTRYNNLYLPATESRETTQKHYFGPKEVDWACSLRKTRRNFGSTKWCIVSTPKPDLTTGTSLQRNRAKPPRNLVSGLKKWIGHVRCEKTRRNFGSTKWCILCNPKPDITTCTSRQRNRAKPPRNLVLA